MIELGWDCPYKLPLQTGYIKELNGHGRPCVWVGQRPSLRSEDARDPRGGARPAISRDPSPTNPRPSRAPRSVLLQNELWRRGRGSTAFCCGSRLHHWMSRRSTGAPVGAGAGLLLSHRAFFASRRLLMIRAR